MQGDIVSIAIAKHMPMMMMMMQTYVERIETGAKAFPAILLALTERVAAGVLMEVNACAEAAMARTAIESFMVQIVLY